jgi:hypothetical protein
MFKKNDPLVDSIKQIMEQNEAHRQIEQKLCEELGIASRKALPHEHQANYDALLEQRLAEVLDTKDKRDAYKNKAEKSLKDNFGKKDDKASHTVSKRLDGIARVEKKSIKKEEVEKIDEVSAGKLGRYLPKASASRDDAKDEKEYFAAHDDDTGPEDKIIRKRTKGMNLAMRKLTGRAKVNAKEEVELGEEGSHPRNAKEAELAKHHGDPKKITKGDVLKARGVVDENASSDPDFAAPRAAGSPSYKDEIKYKQDAKPEAKSDMSNHPAPPKRPANLKESTDIDAVMEEIRANLGEERLGELWDWLKNRMQGTKPQTPSAADSFRNGTIAAPTRDANPGSDFAQRAARGYTTSTPSKPSLDSPSERTNQLPRTGTPPASNRADSPSERTNQLPRTGTPPARPAINTNNADRDPGTGELKSSAKDLSKLAPSSTAPTPPPRPRPVPAADRPAAGATATSSRPAPAAEPKSKQMFQSMTDKGDDASSADFFRADKQMQREKQVAESLEQTIKNVLKG